MNESENGAEISEDSPEDLVSFLATSQEQEIRMRQVYNRVGEEIFQLLIFARNQNFDFYSRIENKGSLAARKSQLFVFAVDTALGAIEKVEN